MTTGGAPEVASDGGVVPDKQGEVNAQHRPSAKSENVRRGGSKVLLTSMQTNKQIICITTLILNTDANHVKGVRYRTSQCLRTSGHYQTCICHLSFPVLFQKCSVRTGNI